MSDDTTLPFRFPAVRGKKVRAAFDGGRLSSDGGVLLLAEAARRMGIAEKLAAVIPDRRDPTRVTHGLAEILLARMLAIACGYEDADDLDSLRTDPAFKLACGRLPDSGTDLMSQPTVSRWENAPSVRDLVRLGRVMIDLYCESYAAPPEAVWSLLRRALGRCGPVPVLLEWDLDLPFIDTEILEIPNPNHPYGIRGVGETSIVPPLAAIGNAISNAGGVRMNHVPMSPPRILNSKISRPPNALIA